MTKTFWVPTIILVLAISTLIGVYAYQQRNDDSIQWDVSMRMWRTSKNWLLFSAPDDWKVEQSDFGGGSVITITKDDGQEASIFTALNRSFEGELINFSDWMEDVAGRNGLRTTCQSATIDSLPALCRQDEQDVKHYFVETPTQYFVISQLEPVHSSINFFPDETATAQAELIP